jgi:hypothetical protein
VRGSANLAKVRRACLLLQPVRAALPVYGNHGGRIPAIPNVRIPPRRTPETEARTVRTPAEQFRMRRHLLILAHRLHGTFWGRGKRLQNEYLPPRGTLCEKHMHGACATVTGTLTGQYFGQIADSFAVAEIALFAALSGSLLVAAVSTPVGSDKLGS